MITNQNYTKGDYPQDIAAQEWFYCYSPPLFLFLMANNIIGTGTGVNKTNGKHYTKYPMSLRLSEALTEWSEVRKHYK